MRVLSVESVMITGESLVESVTVGPHLTHVSVHASYLYWVRTAGHMDSVQFDVDVV